MKLADPRPSISPKLRAQVFAKTDGKCAKCGVKLFHHWHADHIIEHAHRGPTSLENLEPLCLPCHAEKTAERAPVLAHTRRLVKKADPEQRKSKRAFSTRLRKRMNGSVEVRS